MVAVKHFDHALGIAAAALLAAAFFTPEKGDVRRIVVEQLTGKALFALFEQRSVDDIDLVYVTLADTGGTAEI